MGQSVQWETLCTSKADKTLPSLTPPLPIPLALLLVLIPHPQAREPHFVLESLTHMPKQGSFVQGTVWVYCSAQHIRCAQRVLWGQKERWDGKQMHVSAPPLWVRHKQWWLPSVRHRHHLELEKPVLERAGTSTMHQPKSGLHIP